MAGTPLTWWELADAVWLAMITEPPKEGATPPTETPARADPPDQATEQETKPPQPPKALPPPPAHDVPTPAESGPPAITSVETPEPLLALQGSSTALPDAPVILRALRPLRRHVPSPREDDLVFDEEATAERAAQDGLWLPETRRATEPWLDLSLVVDASPSMALWRQRIQAFAGFLGRLRVFRTVQYRLLDTGKGEDGLVPVLRGGTPTAPPRSPTEIGGPAGRRVVLVLTDGIGECWQAPSFAAVLARWGTVLPTAVVHLLPQLLWRRGGLRPQRARVATSGELRPNSRWQVSLPDAWLEPDPEAVLGEGIVPVPVLELSGRGLSRWARLLLGAREPVNAPVLLTQTSPVAAEPSAENVIVPEQFSPKDVTRKFLGIASPPARRLASLLAAVPVSLESAKLIRAELVPEAGDEHIAEALSSGLFIPVSHERASGSWDTVAFAIRPTVREELLRSARRSETARAARIVDSRLQNAFGNVNQVLDAPHRAPDTTGDATIERIVLNALSGPYLHRARKASKSSKNSDSTPVPTIAADENMANVAERTDPSTKPGFRAQHVPEPSATLLQQPGEDTARPETPRSAPLPDAGHTFHGSRADDVPPVWGAIPPRNPNFTGREELLTNLADRLTVGGTTAILPSALHGMGGIGKTQIAVEYIYRHLQDYDIVWWFQAANTTQIRAGLTELAKELELPGSTVANTAVPAVLEALRRGKPYRRWLLIFDAAESPDAVREFFPTNGPGKILVTSRDQNWSGVAAPIEVATFDREESIELLRRRGPAVEGEDTKADQLAETLGDLPLAIEQAAAWRAETGMPISDYLRLFDEKRVEILDTSTPADYEVTVAAAWTVSFDELQERSPAAHQLLQICAFFAPEPITRDLFTGVRSNISIRPELDSALRDPMKLGRAIRDINRYSLAKIDHRKNTLQLHRLVQLVLRERMTDQQKRDIRHGAQLLLANLDPNDPVSRQQWQRYQDILPHAMAADLVECEDGWGRQLVINLVAFLYRWGDHDEAINLAERAYGVWRDTLGAEYGQTLEVASQLAGFYWVVGRFAEAEQLNKLLLEIRRRVNGEDSEETLFAQLDVAADRRAAGDFTGSLQLSTEVHQKARALFGQDDPSTLRMARKYAISLRLCGQYLKAFEVDYDTYQRQVEIIGQDHPETLSALSGMIMDRREAGEYLWARDEQEKLAERARELHGDDSADTLRRLAYLAVARRKAGDHEGAFTLSENVLKRFEIRYGLDTFNAMACALGFVSDLRHAGDLDTARQLGEEVVERYRRNLGEDHPYTYAATVDLAITLRILSDPSSARELNERAVEKLRSSLGPDHAHAICCAINLASDLAALGEHETAMTQGLEIVERAERVLGADHPTTLAASLNLALDLRLVGRREEAETRYADVMARYRKSLGEQHPATVAATKGIRADCDIDPLPL